MVYLLSVNNRLESQASLTWDCISNSAYAEIRFPNVNLVVPRPLGRVPSLHPSLRMQFNHPSIEL